MVILRKLIIPFSASTIAVPPEIAVCPFCGPAGRLTCYMESWELVSKRRGLWKCSGVSLECDTMPDFDDEDFHEWSETHSYMPYVYWHPLTIRVNRWINAAYRFAKEMP